MKQGNVETLDLAIRRLTEHFDTARLSETLGPSFDLVPVPRSSPLVPGALWPAEVIANAVLGAGFGHRVLPCVSRKYAVAKSAFMPRGERPTVVQHFDSMEVERDLLAPERITLVDDVISRGRTMYAAAQRLHQAFPRAEIVCFALIRTMGLQPEVDRILAPTRGRIVWDGRDADRDP